MKITQSEIDVMQHFINGGAIECSLGFNEWVIDKDPSWNWTEIDYRVYNPIFSHACKRALKKIKWEAK